MAIIRNVSHYKNWNCQLCLQYSNINHLCLQFWTFTFVKAGVEHLEFCYFTTMRYSRIFELTFSLEEDGESGSRRKIGKLIISVSFLSAYINYLSCWKEFKWSFFETSAFKKTEEKELQHIQSCHFSDFITELIFASSDILHILLPTKTSKIIIKFIRDHKLNSMEFHIQNRKLNKQHFIANIK